jgi:hypothetical protein
MEKDLLYPYQENQRGALFFMEPFLPKGPMPFNKKDIAFYKKGIAFYKKGIALEGALSVFYGPVREPARALVHPYFKSLNYSFYVSLNNQFSYRKISSKQGWALLFGTPWVPNKIEPTKCSVKYGHKNGPTPDPPGVRGDRFLCNHI